MQAATPSQKTPKEPLDDLDQIYEEHARAIYYLTLRYLGNPARAEDATHDVFLKAFRKLDSFRGRSSLRSWLYRIAINHCKNLQKSWAQRNIHTCADDALYEKVSASSENPLRVLETKELGRHIQETLDELPDEYRVLLLLVADERLSYAEIAEVTDQSIDAVRGKVHRARRAFITHFKNPM